MAAVFISYASADHNLVQREIVGLLKALGFETWFAPEDIRSSELWEPSILLGLESSDWFVVVVSKHAVSSKWVKKELNWAFDHLADRIIPIVIDGCKASALNWRLPKIQNVNYVNNRTLGRHQLIKRLVDAEYRGFLRHLNGEWLCAFQPVYYLAGNGWEEQKVQITPSTRGYVVDTLPAKDKLQWRWNATLAGNAFLVGRWASKRKSSSSHGYMTVQISRNGTYMFGHDYAVVLQEAKAHYGVLLFGKDKKSLAMAWFAMANAQRGLPSLKCKSKRIGQ